MHVSFFPETLASSSGRYGADDFDDIVKISSTPFWKPPSTSLFFNVPFVPAYRRPRSGSLQLRHQVRCHEQRKQHYTNNGIELYAFVNSSFEPAYVHLAIRSLGPSSLSTSSMLSPPVWLLLGILSIHRYDRPLIRTRRRHVSLTLALHGRAPVAHWCRCHSRRRWSGQW